MTALICASIGPRIGDNGQPRCKRELGHNGLHRPAPEDGWEQGLMWSNPVNPDLRMRQELNAAHVIPTA